MKNISFAATHQHQRRAIANTLATVLVLSTTLGLTTACATGASTMKLVNHAFAFRADLDSPDIEIMAYSYGKRSSDLDIKDYGRSNQNNSIRGDMVVGDSLYVKWRIKATNEVFEDTVDLLSRLPKNMTDQRLYFVVQGKQLLVFLTDLNTLKPKESPIVGPFKTQSYLTKQLYPNN